jgi:hypothetical protein
MSHRPLWISNFTKPRLAFSSFFHNIGAFHDLVHFEPLLAKRVQDIFSIIQHD